MKLRSYRPEDCDALMALFHDTVHAVNAKDYSPAQLAAWAPPRLDRERWLTMLGGHYTLVAEMDGAIVGFGDLEGADYFDHLFVHKDHQGRGIAAALAQGIEEEARRRGAGCITVAASITAKPFFEHRGYRVCRRQTVEVRGQKMTNFAMEKAL